MYTRKIRSFCHLMGKRAFVVAIILVVVGLLLVVYRDPQFGLIFRSATSSSTPAGSSFPSSGSSFFTSAASTSRAASSSITVAYSALDIIESLLGAGLVGIGLVLACVGMLSQARIERSAN